MDEQSILTLMLAAFLAGLTLGAIPGRRARIIRDFLIAAIELHRYEKDAPPLRQYIRQVATQAGIEDSHVHPAVTSVTGRMERLDIIDEPDPKLRALCVSFLAKAPIFIIWLISQYRQATK